MILYQLRNVVRVDNGPEFEEWYEDQYQVIQACKVVKARLGDRLAVYHLPVVFRVEFHGSASKALVLDILNGQRKDWESSRELIYPDTKEVAEFWELVKTG